jgi:hypothetical protein
MNDLREDCALGVIETAALRTHQQYLSEGTVESTLERHSVDPVTGWQTWQFPPWIVYGCQGIIGEACLDGYPMDWAYQAVNKFIEGERSSCSGYLFYDSIPGGRSECVIETKTGRQFIEFYNRWLEE